MCLIHPEFWLIKDGKIHKRSIILSPSIKRHSHQLVDPFSCRHDPRKRTKELENIIDKDIKISHHNKSIHL